VTTQQIAVATSTREGQSTDAHAQWKPSGTIPEGQFEMPEPSAEFREAMLWGIKARDALREVEARSEVLTEGFSKLALSEATRLELLAAGNVVGESEARDDVAQQ
jgi:hypothetical protein